MTDNEEFAGGSQLKWQRDGNAWILLYAVSVWAEWDLTKMIQACGARSNPLVVATVPTCLGPRTSFWHRGELAYEAAIPPRNPNKTGGVANRNRHPFV